MDFGDKNRKVEKQELYKWTCKALQCALTSENIKSRFRKVRIWALDRSAAKDAMHPSGLCNGGGRELRERKYFGFTIDIDGEGQCAHTHARLISGQGPGWEEPVCQRPGGG